MIKLKTTKEIEILAEGGHILADIMSQVAKRIKPGVTTKDLDALVITLITASGGRPSFEGYKANWADVAFPSALCVSVNDEVVHGLPGGRKIKKGDIVSIDAGMEYKGLYTDMALSVGVGKMKKNEKLLIKTTEEALYKGIKKVKPGNSLSDIAKAIEKHIEKRGFSVVRQLVGHGVGYGVHEEPQVPNYSGSDLPDIKLKPGLVLALEPMANIGGSLVETLADGWTIATEDGSKSAHFEHTVAVTESGCRVLTE